MSTDNPTPAPAPTPQPTAVANYSMSGVVNELCTLALILVLSYLAFFRDRPSPSPVIPSGVDFVGLGKSYKADLVRVMGEHWTDAGTKIASGQPIGTTLQAMSKDLDAQRTQLFASKVSPAFAMIVPENTDDFKVTPSQRAALGKAWTDFGQGLSK